MCTACAGVPFFALMLLGSVFLAAASAALPPSAASTSSDGIISLQQQDKTPLALTISTNNTVTVPTIVPISGTDIFLQITYVDPTWFATMRLSSLFRSAHNAISESVVLHPDGPVAPLPWYHSSYSKKWRDTVAIRIRVNVGKVLTWLQLDFVLSGLMGFMVEGVPMLSHPINFEIHVGAQGAVAAGLLWYSQSPLAQVVEERMGS